MYPKKIFYQSLFLTLFILAGISFAGCHVFQKDKKTEEAAVDEKLSSTAQPRSVSAEPISEEPQPGFSQEPSGNPNPKI